MIYALPLSHDFYSYPLLFWLWYHIHTTLNQCNRDLQMSGHSFFIMISWKNLCCPLGVILAIWPFWERFSYSRSFLVSKLCFWVRVDRCPELYKYFCNLFQTYRFQWFIFLKRFSEICFQQGMNRPVESGWGEFCCDKGIKSLWTLYKVRLFK